MSRFGKCQNLSGCLLAYRGEETEVEKDQPFICAECGKPLAEVKSPAAFWMRYVYGLVGVLVLAGAAFAIFPQLRGLIVKHSEHHEPGEKPAKSEDSSSSSTGGNAGFRRYRLPRRPWPNRRASSLHRSASTST